MLPVLSAWIIWVALELETAKALRVVAPPSNVRRMRNMNYPFVTFELRYRSVSSCSSLMLLPPARTTQHILKLALLQLQQQQLGSYEELLLDQQSTDRNRRVQYYDCTISSSEFPIIMKNNTVQPGRPIEYHTAWNIQKRFVQSHFDRLANTTLSSFVAFNNVWDDASIGIDTIVFLEHEPVYTLGTGSDASFIQSTNTVPIVRMDRGGEVTYHGPGQLTVYPIIDLRNYNQDIHWYVRALEEVIIRALNACANDASVYTDDGVVPFIARREDNVTGVWINEYKVAAIGVKCRKWITQHGFAINITPQSMQHMDGIVPCGLIGRKVGYVNQFLSQQLVTVPQMTQYVVKALEDVFQVKLISMND
jgi:lipoyl(octanoyl) transferase